MDTRPVISLLCVGAVAFACGPRSHPDPAVRPLRLATVAQAAPRFARNSKKPRAATVVRLSSRFRAKPAPDGVRFVLEVSNVGDRRVELTFPNGQTHDFAVVDSVGREVWRWSADRMFTQSLRNTLLDKGETMRIEERWSAPVRGTYTAIARLKSSNHPVEERTTLVLP